LLMTCARSAANCSSLVVPASTSVRGTQVWKMLRGDPMANSLESSFRLDSSNEVFLDRIVFFVIAKILHLRLGNIPRDQSASGHERMVNGRAAASGEEKFDLPEAIARFGDTLNTEGPLVEIRSLSVFGISAVIRSIFSTCNALGQDGLPTLPDVPPSVCYPSGRHRQRRRPKPGGQRNLDPRIGRERASRHGDCQHHGGRGPAVRDRSTQVKCW